MKCPHCASVLLLTQHSRREGSTLPRATVASKGGLHQLEPRRIGASAPARCASMRITKAQPAKFRSDAELPRTAEVAERAEQRLREAYLDGLRGLAFHLVRHGGGLIHVGTPTAHLRTETRAAVPASAACCRMGEPLFGVRLEARNRI